jgi:hypothetical protein
VDSGNKDEPIECGSEAGDRAISAQKGLVRQHWFEAQHDFILDQDQVDPCLPLNPGDSFIPAKN